MVISRDVPLHDRSEAADLKKNGGGPHGYTSGNGMSIYSPTNVKDNQAEEQKSKAMMFNLQVPQMHLSVIN